MNVAYHPTAPGDITKGLMKLFGEPSDKGKTLLRAANHNVMVLLPGKADLPRCESVIMLLSNLHPSRYFIIYLDESLKDFDVGVAAFCHPVSATQEVCSEIVRVGVPPSKRSGVPSLMRAHLVSNVAAEIFMTQGCPPDSLLEVLLPLADIAYLDSRHFESRLDVLDRIVSWGGHVIDLEWIGLGSWRSQIKNVFDQPALAGMVKGIDRIEVRAPEHTEFKRPSLKAFLMAGWLIDRLGLVPEKSHAQSMDFRSPFGGGVRVTVRPSSASEDEETLAADTLEDLSSVTISGIGRGGREAQVRLEHQGRELSTYFRIEDVFRFSRPLEDESTEGRLKRYFLIGESTANYLASLKAALQFARMATPKRSS